MGTDSGGLNPENLAFGASGQVIARDRSQFFANGGRAGAPAAVQVHDRYHLVSSLREAVEREAHRLQIRAHAELAPGGVYAPRPLKRSDEARRLRCRQARYERYLVVAELRRQGLTQLAIAAKVGIDPTTVAMSLSVGRFPERRIRRDRRRDYARLQDAVARGCPSALRHFSAGRVAALLVQPPPSLSEPQKMFLEGFLRLCPDAHRLRRMALQFQALLRWRKASGLPAWIEAAVSSGFESVAEFARALRRDWLAVQAASTPWSNGPVEGQINRLKAIKRQMYGRAGFAWLKARVLPLELEEAS